MFKRRGFTLAEVLVTVTIVAVLAAVMVRRSSIRSAKATFLLSHRMQPEFAPRLRLCSRHPAISG